jgi:hypothetical protein
MADVSHRISFAAHASALARTRRSRGPLNRCRPGKAGGSRDSISPEGANQRSETQALGRSVRNQIVHIAIKPTPPSLQALKRTSTISDSRNIGEAQALSLDRGSPPPVHHELEAGMVFPPIDGPLLVTEGREVRVAREMSLDIRQVHGVGQEHGLRVNRRPA